jgi:hypothetical protein
MFLTYGDPLNYWKTWFPSESSNHVIVIHNKNPLSEFWKKYAIPQEYVIQTSWGTPSIVKATLSLLNYATSMQCSHYVLLSDSCVPLYNYDKIIGSIQDLKLSNIHEKKTLRKGGILYKTQCQWCIFIHGDACNLIINENFQVYNRFKILDEVYFVNEVKHFSNKPLTYVNWKEKTQYKAIHSNRIGNHPKVWKHISVADIHYIRSTGALFMRKCTNETNFQIFQTPIIYFDEPEKQIFRKMMQYSKDKKVNKYINIILKTPLQHISDVCNRNKETFKNDKIVWQLWNTLSQVIVKGAHNCQVLF